MQQICPINILKTILNPLKVLDNTLISRIYTEKVTINFFKQGS